MQLGRGSLLSEPHGGGRTPTAGVVGCRGGVRKDRSCPTAAAAAISSPRRPTPGPGRAVWGNGGQWGKSPCCSLRPGSCDELCTGSARLCLSTVPFCHPPGCGGTR